MYLKKRFEIALKWRGNISLKRHPDPYPQPLGTHAVEVPSDFYTLEKTTCFRYNTNQKFSVKTTWFLCDFIDLDKKRL